jgi:hypothetical protein
MMIVSESSVKFIQSFDQVLTFAYKKYKSIENGKIDDCKRLKKILPRIGSKRTSAFIFSLPVLP